MRVEGRAYQAALKSYGFDPGALDGVIGPSTLHATEMFDEWVEFSEGGELWGDYAIVPAVDNRSVDITPDLAARRFQTRGTAYLAEHPEEVVFPRTRSTSVTPRSTGTDVAPRPPAPLALPFFRSNNLWLWLFAGLGFLSLGAGAFFVARSMKRRR